MQLFLAETFTPGLHEVNFPMTQTLHIKGMTCGGCVHNVTAALDSIPGISKTTVDLRSNSAIITADREIPRNVLFEHLDKAGYALQ